MYASLFIAFLFPLAFLSTGIVRRVALRFQCMDIPNHRSSHTNPTPRGGGLSFVVLFLAALPFMVFWFNLPSQTAWSLAGMTVIVAMAGLLDDYFTLSVRWRFPIHMLAAAWVLYGLGGMPDVQIFGHVLPSGIFMNLAAWFYLVWMLNLYNFMDGIDGIAAMEAITTCFGACFMYYVTDNMELGLLPLMLAVIVAGFLFWNFPRAKIFMGDAGSGFLGLILGAFSIQAASVNISLFFGWLILMGVFIIDATITLGQRALQGERIFEAHRTHAYQHASSYLRSHSKVTLTVAIINLFWLLPIALLVVLGFLPEMIGLGIAWCPLVAIAVFFGAGKTSTCGSKTGRQHV